MPLVRLVFSEAKGWLAAVVYPWALRLPLPASRGPIGGLAAWAVLPGLLLICLNC
jgi:hypothetical protein